MRLLWMGCDWSMCPSLNTWVVFWMNQLQMVYCCRKVMSRRKIADAIRSRVNARGLKLECWKMLHETL